MYLFGIQPSNMLHLGNFITIKPLLQLKACYILIADLHALTTTPPDKVKEYVYDTIAMLIALGLRPEEYTFILQSHNPHHLHMYWYLSSKVSVSKMRHMTQYKLQQHQKGATVGLFTYPILQAADILLYLVHHVVVGQDQVQHVELSCDIANSLNREYTKDVVVVPKVYLASDRKIFSLLNPQDKMSKSNQNDKSRINLMDTRSRIHSKIMGAVTDNGPLPPFTSVVETSHPELYNILHILHTITDTPMKVLWDKWEEQNYQPIKEIVSRELWYFLQPIQERYIKIRQNIDYLNDIMTSGTKKGQHISQKTIDNLGLSI